MKYDRRLFILTIFSIFVLCIGVTIKEFQNDTFYMIKLGEYIHSHGIDLLDHWCWVTNLSYTYPHWLYDIIIYFIYSLGRFRGVYISTIFFFIILILSIYFVHLCVHKNRFLAFFISIMSIVCLYGFATARAQLLTTILFFWEVYVIEKLIETGNRKYMILLMIFSLLIANLHATVWLFYFILFLPFIGEHLCYLLNESKLFKEKFLSKKIAIQEVFHFKKLMISMICSFGMGVFTPSRICYSYIFRVMLGDSQSFIAEHAPIVVIQNPCFCVFILVLLLILIFSIVKIKLRELFMICGLILMCLMSVRHLAFFYTIGLYYIGKLCIRYLEYKQDKTLDILGMLLVSNKVIYFFCFVLITILSFHHFQKNQKFDYVNEKEYPIQASIFIQENLDISTIRLYNDYNYGSYLMFQEIPVFIDSRCDLYLSEFNGLSYSIFDDDMEMEYNYKKNFDFYDFTHILLSKEGILYFILEKRDGYQVLYQDKYFILFERVIG